MIPVKIQQHTGRAGIGIRAIPIPKALLFLEIRNVINSPLLVFGKPLNYLLCLYLVWCNLNQSPSIFNSSMDGIILDL